MPEENKILNVRDLLLSSLNADKNVEGGITDCNIFVRSIDPDTGDEVLLPVVGADYDETAQAFVVDTGEAV